MGLARDGSIGVLTMRWRRVEVEGALYVEEYWGGSPGPIWFGPIPDEATCTALIRERAAFTKANFEAGRDALLARFPLSMRADQKVLEDDDGD